MGRRKKIGWELIKKGRREISCFQAAFKFDRKKQIGGEVRR